MKKYKVSRAISEGKLKSIGFEEIPSKRRLTRKYSLRKKISDDTNLEVIITRLGNIFHYNNKKGSIIYVGNEFHKGCNPSVIENSSIMGFEYVRDRYNQSMDVLVDEGVLTYKYKPRKKN